MTTASQQSRDISTSLGTFYQAKSSSVSATGADPSTTDLVSSLRYEELLRRSSQDYTGAADPSTAAAVEQAHEAAAVIREVDLCNKSRADLYGDVSSEYSTEAAYHNDRATFLTSLLNQETRVPYLG